MATMLSSGMTAPPAALCVFSMQISFVGASARSPEPLMAASTSRGWRAAWLPLGGRGMAPATTERPPVVDVRGLLDDDLAATAAMRDDRRQVGHGAGRQEQSVVLAGQAGGEALEFVDGRIITPPRVAEARLHDGRHH